MPRQARSSHQPEASSTSTCCRPAASISVLRAGKADRVPNDLQITLPETDARPAGRSGGAYPVDRGERADFWVIEGRNVAGAGPAGRDECGGAHALRSTSTETPSAAERTAASARMRAARAVLETGARAGPAMDGLDERSKFEAVRLGVALQEKRVIRGDALDRFGAEARTMVGPTLPTWRRPAAPNASIRWS